MRTIIGLPFFAGILLPEAGMGTTRVIQHLAGEVLWEGSQHCLRCGIILAGNVATHDVGFPTGHVYQVDGRFCRGDYEDFDLCA